MTADYIAIETSKGQFTWYERDTFLNASQTGGGEFKSVAPLAGKRFRATGRIIENESGETAEIYEHIAAPRKYQRQ